MSVYPKGFGLSVITVRPYAVAFRASKLRPYVMDISLDAAILEDKFPLVIISHGNGGSHLLNRTISIHLAQLGCVVSMPEQFGNNRKYNSLENTMHNLIFRPRHISLIIDAILEDAKLKYIIFEDCVAVIGHSMG